MEEIPLFDLRPWVDVSYVQFHGEIGKLLHSGQFIGGGPLIELQDHIRKLTHTATSLPLASGTDALTIGLRALKEENRWARPIAVVPDFTFQATANAALMAGYELVLTDIQPNTYCMGWSDAVWAIGERIREVSRGSPDGIVIVPVHLYGNICDVPVIRESVTRLLEPYSLQDKLYIMEDAAQGFGGIHYSGAPVGSMGDLAALSFFPTKPFGGYGDGGMLLAQPRGGGAMGLAISIARHGLDFTKSFAHCVGTNSRLDTIQAIAILQKIRQFVEIRCSRFDRLVKYYTLLKSIGVKAITQLYSLSEPDDSGNSKHTAPCCPAVLTIELSNPDVRRFVVEHLLIEGIKTGCYYPVPLHQQLVYQNRLDCRFYTTHVDPTTYEPLPVSEKAASCCLSLPFFWGIRKEQIERVVNILQEALDRYAKTGTDQDGGQDGVGHEDNSAPRSA